jgi:hypothetical protein
MHWDGHDAAENPRKAIIYQIMSVDAQLAMAQGTDGELLLDSTGKW